MSTGTHNDSGTGVVLEYARAQQAAANDALVNLLCAGIGYAESHQEPLGDPGAPAGDVLVDLPGIGVSEFAIIEFATAMGWAHGTALCFLAEGLELAHRLPQTWARVLAGQVPLFRARTIARLTRSLPDQGATWVDAQVVQVAHRLGPRATERFVERARDLYDPEAAEERRRRQAEQRRLHITRPRETDNPADGLGYIDGVVDAHDAAAFDSLITQIAHQLWEAGNHHDLDIRRAQAIGHIAHGHHPTPTPTPTPDDSTPDDSTPTPTPAPAPTRTPGSGRSGGMELVVHLTDDALTGIVDTPTLGTHLMLDQVLDWIHRLHPDEHITIRPVIDLNENLTTTGYAPTRTQQTQIRLENPTCVFPFCHQPAHTCDLDHIQPYSHGGNTTSTNLAPLCRKHHRAKTHGNWTYHKHAPGQYRWHSPTGLTYDTDPIGTTPLPNTPEGAVGGRWHTFTTW